MWKTVALMPILVTGRRGRSFSSTLLQAYPIPIASPKTYPITEILTGSEPMLVVVEDQMSRSWMMVEENRSSVEC